MLSVQGQHAETLTEKFNHCQNKLADEFLIPETNYENFVAILAFLKEHPRVNEQVLQYAFVTAMLQRDDISHSVPNPIEV